MMSLFGSGYSRGSPKPMRIVVVGEKGTRKSSLIMTAVDKSFHPDPNIPPVLPYTKFPPKYHSNPTIIIDTSSRPEDREEVIKEVKEADAIVFTFVIDIQETLDRFTEYWIPLFRQLEVRVPVIIAGFRVIRRDDDNIEYISQTSMEEITRPIRQQYGEVETCLDWSTHLGNRYASRVFGYAQKSVIYPLSPIYDLETNTLKPRCAAALKRIYILSSTFKNDEFILGEDELNNFQIRCFNTPLTPSHTKSVLKAVRERCPQGVIENRLTIDGFLTLNTYLIEHGQFTTVWTILGSHGYNNELRLVDDKIPYSSFKRKPDQSVELTDETIKVLKIGYQYLDEAGENSLGPEMIGCIFQSAPESPWDEAPYKDAAEQTNNGELSIEAFLSLWSLMTLIDPARSLEYIICVCYPKDPSSSIRVTPRRKQDRKKQKSERQVIQCFVFGPKNAGKSAILNQFIQRPYDDDNKDESTEERYAVNMVVRDDEVVGNKKKVLVMKEIQFREDGILPSNEALAACDVAIFVYDSSDESSWKRAIDLLAEVATASEDAGYEFPCLMVAAKTDLDSFPMAIQESTRATQDIGIEAPIPISSKLGEFGNLFEKILTAAEHPHFCLPVILESKKKQRRKLINRSLTVVSIGTAVFIVGLASFRLYAARKQS